MAETTWDIDGIVRTVMRRLAESPGAAPPSVCVPPAAAACAQGDELSVTAAVVSLAALEAQLAGGRPADGAAARVVAPTAVAARLDGLRRLVVRRGAVVTPAVRDLLRQHGIALVTAIDSQSMGPGKVPLTLAAATTTYDPAPLVASLARETTVAEIPAVDLMSGIAALADRVGCGASLGLLVTDQTAAALCLANRDPAIRAAAVRDAADVAAVVQEIGANVLVVNPAQRGTAALAAIARAFCQQGPQPCPAALRDALGREQTHR
jgi:hypothetical protein